MKEDHIPHELPVRPPLNTPLHTDWRPDSNKRLCREDLVMRSLGADRLFQRHPEDQIFPAVTYDFLFLYPFLEEIESKVTAGQNIMVFCG